MVEVEVEEESLQMDDAELGIECDDDDSDEEIRVRAKNDENEDENESERSAKHIEKDEEQDDQNERPAINDKNELRVTPAQRGESCTRTSSRTMPVSSRTMPVSASSSISPSDDERFTAPAKNCPNPAKNERPAKSDASRISPSDAAQRAPAGNDSVSSATANTVAALKEEDEMSVKMCAGGGGGGSVERGEKPPASPESQRDVRDVSPLLAGYLHSATQDCIARLLFGSTEGGGLGDAVFLNFLVADA